jgi:hypothetical protein
MYVIPGLLLKADTFKLVTFFGMISGLLVSDAIALFAKALLPMVFTDSGNVTNVNPLPWNEQVPSDVTVFPILSASGLFVPAPDFESSISLIVDIGVPKIDVSINMSNFDIRPPELDITYPLIIEPSVEVQTAYPLYVSDKINFNNKKIYEYVKKRIKL